MIITEWGFSYLHNILILVCYTMSYNNHCLSHPFLFSMDLADLQIPDVFIKYLYENEGFGRL